jgi:hypothetical protein
VSRYVLPAGMDEWPQFRAISLTQVGAYVSVAMWTHRQNTSRVHKWGWEPYRRVGGCDPSVLADAGLWIRTEKDTYDIPALTLIRGTRARAGLVMKLSHRLPDGMEASSAGLAAFGLWCLAASWSLGTETPGYVPTDVALRIGKQRHVAALWHTKMWRVDEYGFHMAQGRLEFDPWWKLGRDGVRDAIPVDIRRAVYERDGWKCVKCSSTDHLALDHIYPWSKGGPDTVDNLRVLCRTCNSAKGARLE